MNFDKKIEHKEMGSRDIIDIYEIMFHEYGWSYEEIMNIPIPSFLETIEALKRRKEKEVKASKGKKKGKRMGV